VSRATPDFRVEPLGSQDRTGFSCGVEALDRYFREQADQDQRRRAAAPFVLLTADHRIAGYYTLSAAVLASEAVPAELMRKFKWPRYPQLPATLIGRLARDQAFRGQGVGERLLLDAIFRASASEIASPRWRWSSTPLMPTRFSSTPLMGLFPCRRTPGVCSCP
jgi:GNAT superfamily N-acetyltransferase